MNLCEKNLRERQSQRETIFKPGYTAVLQNKVLRSSLVINNIFNTLRNLSLKRIVR